MCDGIFHNNANNAKGSAEKVAALCTQTDGVYTCYSPNYMDGSIRECVRFEIIRTS